MIIVNFCSVFYIILFLIVFASDVSAYLDPGTGSYIFQVVIALLVSSAFAVKMFWQKIKSFFMNIFKK